MPRQKKQITRPSFDADALATGLRSRRFHEWLCAAEQSVGGASRMTIAATAMLSGKPSPGTTALWVRIARWTKAGRQSTTWRKLARIGLRDRRHEVRVDALVAIRVHGPRKEDAPVLRKLGRHTDAWLRKLAIYAAGELRGRDGQEIVERALSDPSVAVRDAAAFAVSCSPWEADVCERLLLLALLDRNARVRATALRGLAERGRPFVAAHALGAARRFALANSRARREARAFAAPAKSATSRGQG